MRIERERDGDSECAGGGGNARKWAGADLFFGDRGSMLRLAPSGGPGGVTISPTGSQSIVQPVGSQMTVNNLSGVRYVTASDNWSASPSGSLVGGNTGDDHAYAVSDGSRYDFGFSMYYVYLSVQGTAEPAMVTGGTCTAGAASGTIMFTPNYSHSAGYTISSASSGIQEAINDACGLPRGERGEIRMRM